MKYKFSFYQEKDYEDIKEMIIRGYQSEYPAVGLSRLEFARGLHPRFLGYHNAWKQTVGVYREKERIVACVWNEGCYDGSAFFIFDSKKRAEEKDLLVDMISFSKMYVSIKEKEEKRWLQIFIPEWNERLKEAARGEGMKKVDWAERILIKDFSSEKLDVNLPKGYTMIDGNTSSVHALANIHRVSFGYDSKEHGYEHGVYAFEELRSMKHYDPYFDLCVLDERGRPIAMALIWYDKKMPYCELEPMAVAWWERRKGIGTAILNEACNRVLSKYPNCKGMRGGDQKFYQKIGFKERAIIPAYQWEKKIYISWDERSIDGDYTLV